MAASNSRTLAMFLFIAIFANGMLSCAQQPIAAQEFTAVSPATAAVLEQMTRTAGVIFAGEVISVRRPIGYAGSAQDASEGTVVIGFRVAEAVRGCNAGSVYTLREWAGLWTGSDRYRVGRRLLLFLHFPDTGGLSSPMRGLAGAVPLRGGGVAPGPYDASATPSEWVVDLRWVEAQAVRETAESGDPTRRPLAEGQSRAFQEVTADRRAAPPELVPAGSGFAHWTALARVSDRSMPSLAQVLNLCRAWASAQPGGDRTGGDRAGNASFGNERATPDGTQ